ncbi:hypothetical protein [Parasphingorhabdus sp.]|uniref:hypothetical protein n=1 Tax=Parasphingorhabdus sp. TaxID=2709688 RepID=UPI003C737DE4
MGADVVLVEFWLAGTHLGPLTIGERVIEPTDKALACGWWRVLNLRRGRTG